jgi:hypothetical protein
MSVELRWGQCCVTEGCLRPARELGGHCTRCWQGLAPFERALLQWEASPAEDTEPIDSQAIALCVELEAILDLPAIEPKRWAA